MPPPRSARATRRKAASARRPGQPPSTPATASIDKTRNWVNQNVYQPGHSAFCNFALRKQLHKGLFHGVHASCPRSAPVPPAPGPPAAQNHVDAAGTLRGATAGPGRAPAHCPVFSRTFTRAHGGTGRQGLPVGDKASAGHAVPVSRRTRMKSCACFAASVARSINRRGCGDSRPCTRLLDRRQALAT